MRDAPNAGTLYVWPEVYLGGVGKLRLRSDSGNAHRQLQDYCEPSYLPRFSDQALKPGASVARKNT